MTDKRKLLLLAGIALLFLVLYVVIGLNGRNWEYALPRRLPRALAMVVVGGAIASSTLVFQTITHNRILTPSIMGLDSMYMLLQTALVFALGQSSVLVHQRHWNFLLSVLCMMGFAALLYQVLFRRESQDIFFLLLIGLIFGTLLQSFTSFMQMVMDPNEFMVVQNRMFASFNNMDTGLLVPALLLLGLSFLYLVRSLPSLDTASLGRDNAINLGVRYNQLVYRMLLIVAVMVSVSTALVGPITFLGLLTANVAREYLRTYKHRILLLAGALWSVVFLVGGQLLVERLLNFAAPISVLINLVGGVYFIYLLLRQTAAE